MSLLDEATRAAEHDWLESWSAGPREPEGRGLPIGADAPDLRLLDHTGEPRQLSEFWTGRPALLMFWRHFGCGCGVARAERLKAEWKDLVRSGLTPVIIGQGEPVRAAEYRERHKLPCPVLTDPDRSAYRAYGIGQWPVERILYDAPASLWRHGRVEGAGFQRMRREMGRPLVDDPWRAAAEFVVRPGGTVQLPYLYQYCDGFPDPRVLTTAALLSVGAGDRGTPG